MSYKLKEEFKQSSKIAIRFNSAGRFYPVSQEKALEMMEKGEMPRQYWDMFEPCEKLCAKAKDLDEKAGNSSEAKKKAKLEVAEAKATYEKFLGKVDKATKALEAAKEEDKAKANKTLETTKAQASGAKKAYEEILAKQ